MRQLLVQTPYEGYGTCAPTAVYEVAPEGWSSDDVMEVARDNGFPYDVRTGGWDVEKMEQGMTDLCIEWERANYGGVEDVASGKVMFWQRGTGMRPTLAKFIRSHPTGTYLIIVKGHALVIRDGQIIDPNWHGRRAARRQVWIAYRIDNPGPQKYYAAAGK